MGMTETQVTQEDIRNALRLAWHALLNWTDDIDVTTNYMAVRRAIAHADKAHPLLPPVRLYDDRPAEWFAAAINHYLDR